jgi:hypothetical protein
VSEEEEEEEGVVKPTRNLSQNELESFTELMGIYSISN